MLNKKNIIERIKKKPIESGILGLLILIIIWAGISFFTSTKNLDGVVQKLEEDKTIFEKKLCFLDKENNYLEIDFSKKPIISGFLKIKENSEKNISGEFIGANQGDLINIIVNKKGNIGEQFIYKIADNKIIPASFLEKKENKGALMISDIKKVTFNEENSIEKVNCNSVDKKKMGI